MKKRAVLNPIPVNASNSSGLQSKRFGSGLENISSNNFSVFEYFPSFTDFQKSMLIVFYEVFGYA